MRQVVAIHGGDTYASEELYVAALRGTQVNGIDWFKPRMDWKANLPQTLGAAYEVLLPKMPNKQNAKYEEWKIWFEKIIPFLEDGAILIGHSLGGVFLARYLSESVFPKKIAATMLVAAPYFEGRLRDGTRGEDFVAPDSLESFARQGGEIFLYHSEDDPVVPFSELAKYQAALPSATARVFKDRKHFNQPDFPELVADIQNL